MYFLAQAGMGFTGELRRDENLRSRKFTLKKKKSRKMLLFISHKDRVVNVIVF